MNADEKIKIALAEGGNLTLPLIEERTGLPKSYVWQRLRLLILRGYVYKVGRGLYARRSSNALDDG